MMIERHHLSIIDSVQRYGTLSAAADALNLTQSALSHSIKKLEYQLGTPVWRKEGRLLVLTDAGHKLRQLANRVLPQFTHTEELVKRIANGQLGILRIGMECYPCFDWLLKILGPYLKRYPDVDVDVKKAFQFGGIGPLLAYDLDMLITPDPLHHENIQYIPAFDYEHALVVNETHPLAAKTYVDPADLAEETLITYPIETSRLDIFSQFLTPAGHIPAKHKQIETTEILLEMVAASQGVTAMPVWLIENSFSHLPVTTVKLGKKGLNKTIYLGMRKDDDIPRYLEDFIALCQEPDSASAV